jgi:hypothetical protein
MNRRVVASLVAFSIVISFAAGYLGRAGQEQSSTKIITVSTNSTLTIPLSVSTQTTTATVTTLTTVTSTTPLTWIFQGAYANYTGTYSSGSDNGTASMEIRINSFNLTSVEYEVFPFSANNPRYTSQPYDMRLNYTESIGHLVCQFLSDPLDVNVTVSGTQIAAIQYSCFVGPNDYGVVSIGKVVPFILQFSHHITVTPYAEDFIIRSTNIPGLPD